MGPVSDSANRAQRQVGGGSVTSRVIRVLGVFDAEHPTLTLSQISRRARLPLSTTHRIVGELRSAAFLVKREDGAYTLGRKLWDLGLLAPVNRELREAALPLMQDVFQATRENVHLAIRDGTSVLFVERISGRQPVHMISEAGRRLPLYATGVGKALLAHAPPPLVDRVLADLTALTPHTVVDDRRMRQELAEVRRRGYARTAQELSLGRSSVGVPVFGPGGEAVAALGIVVAGMRRDLVRLVPALQVAARGITRQLGPWGGGR